METSPIEEIETLIRARYPILYVLSGEEARVTEALVEIGTRRKKSIIEWSCNTGLVPAGVSLQSRQSRDPQTTDPVAALNRAIEQVDPAIFVFKDFHPCLGRNHPETIRRLKEIAVHLKNSYKTIVLVSPVLEIPTELEKEITVVNSPLPGREELAILLDEIVEEISGFNNVSVNLDADGRERLLQAALGLTLSEAENVFARIVVKHESLSGDHVHEVFAEKQQIIRKSGLLEYCSPEEDFSQVGGLAGLKDWLRKRAAAFTDEARSFGLPSPKGILLLGVQGCGKSLCAKAVASLWRLPLFRFHMGRMFGSYVGSSEENVRKAIAVAESVAPAILWVDERQGLRRDPRLRRQRQRHHGAGVRNPAHLDVREDRAGVRRRHRQRYFRSAGRTAAQGTPGRDLLRRSARRRGTRGHRPDPPDQTRTRPGGVRRAGTGIRVRRLQRGGDRGGRRKRTLRCIQRERRFDHGTCRAGHEPDRAARANHGGTDE